MPRLPEWSSNVLLAVTGACLLGASGILGWTCLMVYDHESRLSRVEAGAPGIEKDIAEIKADVGVIRDKITKLEIHASKSRNVAGE